MLPRDTDPCPCGRTAPRAGKAPAVRAYADCCGRYLPQADDSAAPVPDAESLMRSRYTAFVCEQRNHLLTTWHPSTRPATLEFEPGARWLGLDVRSHRVLDADHAEVEFVARYRVAGRAVRLHENNRFVREGGRWYYLDGDSR